MIPLIDIALTFIFAGMAIAERGSWVGWVLTLLVFWQTFAVVRMIKES